MSEFLYLHNQQCTRVVAQSALYSLLRLVLLRYRCPGGGGGGGGVDSQRSSDACSSVLAVDSQLRGVLMAGHQLVQTLHSPSIDALPTS